MVDGRQRPIGQRKQKRPRGSTRSKLAIDQERIVAVAAPPRGSRFKGYRNTSFVVQDLVIRPHERCIAALSEGNRAKARPSGFAKLSSVTRPTYLIIRQQARPEPTGGS